MGEKFGLFNSGRILYKGHENYLSSGPLGQCGYHEIISPRRDNWGPDVAMCF